MTMSKVLAPRGSVRPITMAVSLLITALVVAAFSFSVGVSATEGRYTGPTKVTVDTKDLPTGRPSCYYEVSPFDDGGPEGTNVEPICP